MGARLHPDLREVLEPRLKEIESLKGRIQEYELRMEKIANESYRQIELLKQVNGVETQIALTSMLTLDDPHRFAKSREVDCFLRWRPGRRDVVLFFGQVNQLGCDEQRRTWNSLESLILCWHGLSRIYS